MGTLKLLQNHELPISLSKVPPSESEATFCTYIWKFSLDIRTGRMPGFNQNNLTWIRYSSHSCDKIPHKSNSWFIVRGFITSREGWHVHWSMKQLRLQSEGSERWIVVLSWLSHPPLLHLNHLMEWCHSLSG